MVALTVRDDDLGQSGPYNVNVTVNNVRPVLVVALDQSVNEGALLDLSGIGAPPLASVHRRWRPRHAHGHGRLGRRFWYEPASVLETNGSGAILGTHTYADNGLFEVIVTVTDDDGGSDTHSFFVMVANVAPTANLGNNGPVAEGSSATVTFTGQFDPSPTDTLAGFHYAYDFDNDGTFDVGDGTYAGSVTNDSQAVAGNFLDDGPGTRTVRAWIIDKNGDHTEYTTGIEINNVAPTANFGNNGPVPEGSSATVTFTGQFDPSMADTTAGFHYAYDFDNDGTFDVGDGTYASSTVASSQMVPPALVVEGPGSQIVRAWIIDKNGDHTEYFTNVEIKNVDPTLIDIQVDDNTIDEGDSATITMTINDPGALDVFEVDVNWKDGPADTITGLGSANSSGTVGGTDYQWDAQSRQLTVTHLYRDDNPTATTSDLKMVELTVRDDDLGHSGPYNVNVTVNNVRPVLVVALDQSVNEGALLDLSGMGAPPLGLFIDDGVLDTHTATVDWGDGAGPDAGHDSGDQRLRRDPRHAHLRRQRQLPGDRRRYRRRRRLRHPVVQCLRRQRRPDARRDPLADRDRRRSVGQLRRDVQRPRLRQSGEPQWSVDRIVHLRRRLGRRTRCNHRHDRIRHGRHARYGFDRHVQRQPHLRRRRHLHRHRHDPRRRRRQSTSSTFIVTVNERRPDARCDAVSRPSINEGQSVSFDAMFTDPGLRQPAQSRRRNGRVVHLRRRLGRRPRCNRRHDASPTRAACPASDSTGTFGGSHTYADDGTYTVTVTIHDDDGGSRRRARSRSPSTTSPRRSRSPTATKRSTKARLLSLSIWHVQRPGLRQPAQSRRRDGTSRSPTTSTGATAATRSLA